MIDFKPPYCAQGDLNIFICDEIPDGLPELFADKGRHILAHSETGHHHVIDGNAVQVFKQNDFISFIRVIQRSEIVHLRAFDKHTTIGLPPGKYRIARQREYIPEGYRKAQD